jgi:hypothetical protein
MGRGYSTRRRRIISDSSQTWQAHGSDIAAAQYAVGDTTDAVVVLCGAKLEVIRDKHEMLQLARGCSDTVRDAICE